MCKPRFIVSLLLLVVLNVVHAQSPVVTFTIEAGYAGHFRDSEWTPLIIHAANDGDSVGGRLVVRPETSGTGITNTYSTPITLPSGARQTATLYITARSFTTQIRVELIDDSGDVVAQQEAGLSAIQPQDRLSVVVSDSAVGSVDLTGVHASNYNSYQTDWAIGDLPTLALDSVDLMLFSDVDTGSLSSAQKQALTDWVARGGHLIVTGGQNWQATAAGLSDLLPFTPSGSREVAGLQALADWLRLDDDLSVRTVIATGALREDIPVQVFASVDASSVNTSSTDASADGTPLLVRRTLGAGKVDYLAADPNNAPLRGWANLPDVWFTLISDGSPLPGWANGFVDWEAAARSVEILPGYDPLPDILPLCGFLGLYIALVGPLNYLILNRINRREWAWASIPLLILLFSVLSYVLGFNLRGNEVTLNRLAVVQSWHDAANARVDELVGLLSPRRSVYSLSAGNDAIVRPIPRPLQVGGILSRNTQSSVDIRQSEQFAAQDFNVDASFIAGFHVSGMIESPSISGQASFADDLIEGQQVVRGSVRNDSALTLADPVILARGVALHLDQPLAPGDVADFDLTLTGDVPPAPALRVPALSSAFFSYRSSSNSAKQSVIDVLGTDNYVGNITRLAGGDTLGAQINRRRQFFLSSFIDDYSSTGGRGDHVYLAGWTSNVPLATEVTGANWNSQDTTLYVIELDSDRITGAGSVTISPDQFTWIVDAYNGLTDISPINMQLQPGEEVSFRYSPLPDAVLANVERLMITADDLNTGGRSLPIYLWDWDAGEWESVEIRDETATIDDPARFLGPQNAVQVRLVADEIGGFVRITRVTVAQTGTF